MYSHSTQSVTYHSLYIIDICSICDPPFLIFRLLQYPNILKHSLCSCFDCGYQHLFTSYILGIYNFLESNLRRKLLNLLLQSLVLEELAVMLLPCSSDLGLAGCSQQILIRYMFSDVNLESFYFFVNTFIFRAFEISI